MDNLVKVDESAVQQDYYQTFLMKVVMDFENTELIPVAKGRGVKTFNKWFDELKSELRFQMFDKLAFLMRMG